MLQICQLLLRLLLDVCVLLILCLVLATCVTLGIWLSGDVTAAFHQPERVHRLQN